MRVAPDNKRLRLSNRNEFVRAGAVRGTNKRCFKTMILETRRDCGTKILERKREKKKQVKSLKEHYKRRNEALWWWSGGVVQQEVSSYC